MPLQSGNLGKCAAVFTQIVPLQKVTAYYLYEKEKKLHFSWSYTFDICTYKNIYERIYDMII